ncbi:amino acid carrier 3, partial [Haematococcus lacustris]
MVLLMIPLGGVFFCSLSTLTYVARIMFAYSRDKAVPGSALWVKLDSSACPVAAIWGAAIFAFILAIPSVWNELAFTAIISLSTIALNIAYVLPTLARITVGRHRFKPGPWHLGNWVYPIGTIATIYMVFIVVVFSLPTEYPVDPNKNLNYAGVTLGATLAVSLIYYFFPFIGAYAWFKGPVHTYTPSSGSLHGTDTPDNSTHPQNLSDPSLGLDKEKEGHTAAGKQASVVSLHM